MPITLKVKQSGAEGKQISVEVELSASVRDLKARLVAESQIPAEEQRLVYKGQVLKDERVLESYGLDSDHVLHLVRGRPVGGAPSSSPTGASTASTHAPPQSGAAPTAGGMPPFADLFGGGGGGGGGAGGMGGMAGLMDSPVMQSMLDNPEMLRSIFQSNPAIRDLMERNPDLAQMLNNPQVLRESMQMASNPALMREHMRNSDRAISNIESHPEGFNMLRRMYENVQEPLLNATTTGADAPANPQASNPFASLFSAAPTGGGANPAGGAPPAAGATPNAAPLPNPWSAGGGGGAAAARQPQQQPSAAAAAAAAAGGGGVGNPLSGLGLGGGLPGLGAGLGEGDMEQMTQMMQNPAMQQMMQQMMSSPGMMDMLINQNPQLRAATEANPQVREMLSNPEMVQRIMDPANLQAIMQMQQSMQQLNQSGFGSAFGLPAGGGMGDMQSMMNAMMGGGAVGGTPAADPETQYATQLQSLSDMGFSDRQANIRALQATAGNVNAAVERLLSGL
eukprot:CAMPEP_0177768520 /NCGR_PEP_ID=MMETSP0491_2-20121128/9766_1 /TAXON_ID=63592 /ORGANISM="Tetraselmis chuii, Strain PLY429" /LENGTH=507 /DNA_ID=CAMNT_0019285335 /DNA_START=343 /DNA_END=1866 /DNA_ORIENTATION=+